MIRKPKTDYKIDWTRKRPGISDDLKLVLACLFLVAALVIAKICAA